jgi:microsomal dipeptidase-like Zn-dependent dipeptidase
MKPFNSAHPKPKKGMWENIEHHIENKFAQTVSNISQHVLKSSQVNLESLAEGNVRVFNVSLYPIERGFLHLRNVPKWLIGKNKINTLQEVITGFRTERIVALKKDYDYFKDLEDEYLFVEKQQGKSNDGKKSFTLVNNNTELKKALSQPGTLAGIISIEGAHVFGTGTPDSIVANQEELAELLSERISKIKKWKFPPFTINLAHHFWNQLSGHATSFKPPINGIVNQNRGKNSGITELGWQVIRELLSTSNGKRILIDTKHMSIQARKEYYAFVQNYNFVNAHDKIPVICSHGGANGFSTMESSIREPDVIAKARKHKLYRWSINLSNEEIRIIHGSNGLIGLMMDKGMLGGVQTIRLATEIEDSEKQRMEFCRIFWDNAFQIVKAVDDKNGWDVVALGSDFDGTITHMDPYHSAAKMPDFQNDLIRFLEETEHNKELWFGYTPEELVEKIMSGNALRFYERFFV